jgi:hypothetical protein
VFGRGKERDYKEMHDKGSRNQGNEKVGYTRYLAGGQRGNALERKYRKKGKWRRRYT